MIQAISSSSQYQYLPSANRTIASQNQVAGHLVPRRWEAIHRLPADLGKAATAAETPTTPSRHRHTPWISKHADYFTEKQVRTPVAGLIDGIRRRCPTRFHHRRQYFITKFPRDGKDQMEAPSYVLRSAL